MEEFVEVDYQAFSVDDTSTEPEICGYLRVQFPKCKWFWKKRHWEVRYCFIRDLNLTINVRKTKHFNEFEKGNASIDLRSSQSFKVFQNIKRNSGKFHSESNAPNNYVEIIDGRKKKYRLGFVNDDDTNYWVGALLKIFKTGKHVTKDKSKPFMPSIFETSEKDVATTLNKAKPALPGAIEESKILKENEEYKNFLESRASLLNERRNELLRLLKVQSDAVSVSCESKLSSVDDLISSPMQRILEFNGISTLNNTTDFFDLDLKFVDSNSPDSCLGDRVESRLTSALEIPDKINNSIIFHELQSALSRLTEPFSEKSVCVSIPKSPAEPDDATVVEDAQTRRLNRFPTLRRSFVKKICNLYDGNKAPKAPGTDSGNIEPWLKVRGTGQFASFRPLVKPSVASNSNWSKTRESKRCPISSTSPDHQNSSSLIVCKYCRSNA